MKDRLEVSWTMKSFYRISKKEKKCEVGSYIDFLIYKVEKRYIFTVGLRKFSAATSKDSAISDAMTAPTRL